VSATKVWEGAKPATGPIDYAAPKEVADEIADMCEASYPKSQLEHEGHNWRRWKHVTDNMTPEMRKAFAKHGAASAKAARVIAERAAEREEGAYVPAEPEEREYNKQRIVHRVSSNEHVEAEPLEEEEQEEARAPARAR